MVNKNQFGQDPLDFNEETSASRVGRRIREIRKVKEMNQAELGSLVDLSGDRVQKYENGARKPKQELLKKFASALGVSTLALSDPVVSNYLGCMFAFFEMENLYGLGIKRVDDQIVLSFDKSSSKGLYQYLDAWEKKCRKKEEALSKTTREEERIPIINDYRMWEWSFPKALTDKSSKESKKLQLQNKIEELQKELADMQDDTDE